eukprot:5918727-Amphidinium_carterae.3
MGSSWGFILSMELSTVHRLLESRKRHPYLLVSVSLIAHTTSEMLGITAVTPRPISPDSSYTSTVHQHRFVRGYHRRSSAFSRQHTQRSPRLPQQKGYEFELHAKRLRAQH